MWVAPDPIEHDDFFKSFPRFLSRLNDMKSCVTVEANIPVLSVVVENETIRCDLDLTFVRFSNTKQVTLEWDPLEILLLFPMTDGDKSFKALGQAAEPYKLADWLFQQFQSSSYDDQHRWHFNRWLNRSNAGSLFWKIQELRFWAANYHRDFRF